MCFFSSTAAGAQEPMPGMQMPATQSEMHHHNAAQPDARQFPRFGQAQKDSQGKLFILEEAQENGPGKEPDAAPSRSGHTCSESPAAAGGTSCRIRLSDMRAMKFAAARQEEGKQGFFVEQRIVTGEKLARTVKFCKGYFLAEIEAEEQKIRVETAIEMAFLPRPRGAGTRGCAHANLRGLRMKVR